MPPPDVQQEPVVPGEAGPALGEGAAQPRGGLFLSVRPAVAVEVTVPNIQESPGELKPMEIRPST